MTNKTGKEEMKRRVLGIHHIGEKYKAVSNKFKKDENKKGFSIDDFIAQSKKESGADNGAHSGVVVGRSKITTDAATRDRRRRCAQGRCQVATHRVASAPGARVQAGGRRRARTRARQGHG